MINPEKRAGIRTTLAFIAFSGFGMAACAPSSTPEAVKPAPTAIATLLPENTATMIPSATTLPTSTPLPELTRTPIPSPTAIPNPIPVGGDRIQQIIEQAKDGEVITLANAPISHLSRFPWIGGSAVIATLDINGKVAAVFTQADCVFDAFREKNALGPEKYGGWKPNEKVDKIIAKVSAPVSVAVPIPIIDMQSIVYKEKTYICHAETLGGELKRLIRRIDWKNVPENIGEVLGDTTRQFIEGFRRGLKPSSGN